VKGHVEPSVRTRILVREVMNSPVITVSPVTSVKIIAKKMRDHKIGSTIVTQGSEPLGIVTDRDIVVKTVVRNALPSKIRAKDIMSSPLTMIEGDRDIVDAARLMRSHGVKRLGVTYKNELVGIVTGSDLTAVTPELFELISEKTRILRGEVGRKKGLLAGYCDSCNQWSDYLMDLDGKFVCEECRIEVVKEQ